MNMLALVNEIFLIVLGLIGFFARVSISKVDDQVLKGSHLRMAAICLVWSVFYSFVLLGELKLVPLDFEFVRNWLVRPLITLTLALIAAGTIARSRRNGF